MICPTCGTELTEETAFCPECGASVHADPVPETEEFTEERAPETEAVEADDAELSLDELLADVKESFHLEKAQDADAEKAPEEPVSSTYTQPAPVEQEKKKKKEKKEKKPKKAKKKAGKAIRILVPVMAVLLLLAAAAGLYLLADSTYNKAGACLDVKDYAQAEALYARFPFFKDSGEQAELLAQLQTTYDNAAAMVQQHAYNDAISAYSALGTYRDSQILLTQKVPYLQAVYLMENAAIDNQAALAQLPTPADAADTPRMALYKGAAELFSLLGTLEDCPQRASACYLQLASAYMEAERFEEALVCQKNMNEADAAASLSEYMTYCADDALLAAFDSSVRNRYQQTDVTDLQLVNAELEALGVYMDDTLMFYNAELKELLVAYLDALNIQASALDETGFCDDLVVWFTGESGRCAVIERLMELYDFLGDDPDLVAAFTGKAYYYKAAAAIEEELAAQLLGVTGQSSEGDGDYLIFENTTGYSFSLSVSNDFLDEEGNSVFFHRTELISVSPDSTIRIPLLFPDEDGWVSWKTSWNYQIPLP